MSRDTRSAYRFGPTINEDGTVTFRLWAPSAQTIALLMEGAAAIAMRSAPDGFFEATARAEAGTRYRFVLADGRAVPDPASRRQSGGIDGWSVVIDHRGYAWRHAWRGRPWHEAVIYEAHAGLSGGFDGLRRQLPELAALGVTAVQLMPIADVPGRFNWGYDGVLPFAPAEAYGSPEALKTLIDEAHGLGLMVMLDVVYNHFGPAGNYLPTYAAAFFRRDVPTPWGAAVAFDDPIVADFFTANALMWLNDYRFDGLRLDAVHWITPRSALERLGHDIRRGVDGERYLHLVVENERNDAEILPTPFDAQWNDDVHHCLHVLLTGETEAYYRDYTVQPAALLARCLSSGFAYQGEVSPNLGHPRGSPSGHLPPTAFIAFTQNHDQVGNRAFGDRLIILCRPDALRAAMALVLLCPQIPMLFMGEESGSTTPFLFFADLGADLAQAVRDGRRAEFSRFKAFQDEAIRATIPDPTVPATFEASRPAPGFDADIWRAFVRRMLAVRAAEIVPRLPGTRPDGAAALTDRCVRAAWTMGDGATLVIATNLGPDRVQIDLPEGADPLIASGEDGAPRSGVAPYTTRAWLVRP